MRTILPTPRPLAVVGASLLLTAALASQAAMNRGPQNQPAPTPVSIARDLAQAGKCHDALKLLAAASAEFGQDPAYHNIHGYCLRKTGDLERAFTAYARALELKPRYPQAREYLAEAHIDAVLREVRTLRDYGPDAREDLHTLVRHLVRTADGLRSEFPEAFDGAAPEPEGKRW